MIGNDCPALSCHQIVEAKKILNNYDVVLGPEKDGGTYLIGIHGKNFNKSDFQNLDWQTSTLQKSWKNYLKSHHLSHFQLAEQIDIDNYSSLNEVVNTLNRTNILFVALGLIFQQKNSKKDYSSYTIPINLGNPNLSLRAPPLVF